MCFLGKLVRVQPFHTMGGCKQIKQKAAALLLQPKEPTPTAQELQTEAEPSEAQLSLYPSQSLSSLTAHPQARSLPVQLSPVGHEGAQPGKVRVGTWSFQHQAEPPCPVLFHIPAAAGKNIVPSPCSRLGKEVLSETASSDNSYNNKRWV